VAKVFTTYHWADSQAIATRICDLLAARYGANAEFMDVDTIEPGVSFADEIRAALDQCAVQVMIIGKRWLEIRSPDGQRRLDDPKDWARVELEIALELAKQNKLKIITVLVDGAKLPQAADLPGALQPLATLQAIAIGDDPNFTRGTARVTATIERAIAQQARQGGAVQLWPFRIHVARRPLLVAISALLVLASLAVLFSIATQRPTSLATNAQTPPAQQTSASAAQLATQLTAANATIAAATLTPAAQATQTAAAMATQTAAAAATQTTARTVHFPYVTRSPGPGCDAGNAPWLGAGYTCYYGDHTQLIPGPVGNPYLDWYRSDQPNPFPSSYTVSVRVSTVDGMWLVVGSASGSVFQISLQSSAPSGPAYVVERCTSLTQSGGAACTTQTTSAYTIAGSHTLAIAHSGANLAFRVDGQQVATATDASTDTAAVQVAGSGDVTDFSLG
jgi:hypothetical protein